MTNKICIIYSHHKLGDLIWQLPYIKAISEHHKIHVDLIVRKKTQAKEILKDIKHLNETNTDMQFIMETKEIAHIMNSMEVGF